MKKVEKFENAKNAIISKIVADKAQKLSLKSVHCSDCGHCTVN